MAHLNVGLVGLGKMGAPIAGHILKGGYALYVHDLDEFKVKALAEQGAHASSNAAALAKQCDIVIVMVGYDHELREVCGGEDGLFANMASGTVLVVCSTVKQSTIVELEGVARRKGIALLDTPVTRAEQGAISGNLLMLGSGDLTAFEKARPVFQTFCADIFHLGPAGCGQVGKLIHNILLWVSVVANHEAFSLADRCGVDKTVLAQAIKMSTGANGTIGYFQTMTMPWVQKDLSLALEFAETLELGLPLTGLAKQLVKVMGLPKNLNA
jgi:3-hydroxyisobutyrate dehydrogenase-like beta-hydroxyacid dehydrogenase